MKKYLIGLTVFVLIGSFSCNFKQEPKQNFEKSPEIDLVKKAFEAYLNQDWETVRSCYSDTVKIWNNESWISSPGIKIDEAIEESKNFASNIYSYTYEGTLWDIIEINEGEKYVLFWGVWVGKYTADSEEIEIAVHVAYGVVGDKIVTEYGFWDNQLIYLAEKALETEDK